MYIKHTPVKLISFLLLISFISACSKPHVSYVPSYKQSMRTQTDTVNLESAAFGDAWVQDRVNSVMQHLKSADLSDRVKALYANDVYFNDTLHTYTDVNSLANYLTLTGNRVSSIRIDIDDVAVKDKDAYARWTMVYQLGKNKPEIESVGMTHFRFNQAGKITLHQDYWDNVEGFYRMVPVVGYLVKTIQNKTGE